MLRQYDAGAVPTPPLPPDAGSTGYPSDGSAGTDDDGTSIGAYWVHSVTEAICSVIERAGQALSTDVNQFRDAIASLIEQPKEFVTLQFASPLTWNVGTNPRGILTLTGNVSGLTLEGDANGGVYTLLIRQDGTGSRTFAFPSGWKWRAGTAETIASPANQETLLTVRRIGSDIYAAPLLKNMA